MHPASATEEAKQRDVPDGQVGESRSGSGGIQAMGAAWLVEEVQRAVHDELLDVRAALAELREELRVRPPQLSEVPPPDPPPQLPGMSPEASSGGEAGPCRTMQRLPTDDALRERPRSAGCMRRRATDVQRRQKAVRSNTLVLPKSQPALVTQLFACMPTQVGHPGSHDFDSLALLRGHRYVFARARKAAARVVQSVTFDVFVCAALVGNAALIGKQANLSAAKAEPELGYRVVEVTFCVFFTAELMLRLFAWGSYFFAWGSWWNYFDLLLVAFQIFDEITLLIVGVDSSKSFMKDMSVVRLVRVLRLLRILRLLRVIRFVTELRKVIYLIMGSLPSFFWTMVLMTLLVYILAVFFTQIVADRIDEWGPLTAEGEREQEALRFYFGSTLVSTLSLYKAASGGVDWQEISTPIFEHVSSFAGLMFVMFNALAVLVLLNLVTGVFVDGAMKLSRADKEMELLEKAYKLFRRSGEEDCDEISWGEFEGRLRSPEMAAFFEALEISTARAEDLFEFIDRSQDGRISLEELVAGGLMLQGPARAIDIAALSKYLHVSLESLRSDVLAARQ
mmetsp:Transcript_128247/g.359015  ORF Transcript_128247/g.359015 Transcript_128247/m.359015 type:complete len:565 (+) Transcript_128247:61-1755(+)